MSEVISKQRKPNRRLEKQMRYLSQAIQLEEVVNPHIIRSTMAIKANATSFEKLVYNDLGNKAVAFVSHKKQLDW